MRVKRGRHPLIWIGDKTTIIETGICIFSKKAVYLQSNLVYMILQDGIYRARAWLRHCFRARHSKGNGIHSPHLFYIVNMLFYDRNSYYCFHDIENQRARLLRATKTLSVTDYGTGGSKQETVHQRKVSQIAHTSLCSPKEGQLLFRLAEYLKPRNIIELGSSLGISTAYLATATPTATIHTFEGSEAIAAEALKVWENIGISNIRPHIDNIDNSLESALTQLDTIDFAYIDANHTESATLRYFNAIAEYCHEKSVIILDDIYYNRGMGRAWELIKKDKRVTSTIDLFDMGIVFFNKQYWHKHYIVKL